MDKQKWLILIICVLMLCLGVSYSAFTQAVSWSSATDAYTFDGYVNDCPLDGDKICSMDMDFHRKSNNFVIGNTGTVPFVIDHIGISYNLDDRDQAHLEKSYEILKYVRFSGLVDFNGDDLKENDALNLQADYKDWFSPDAENFEKTFKIRRDFSEEDVLCDLEKDLKRKKENLEDKKHDLHSLEHRIDAVKKDISQLSSDSAPSGTCNSGNPSQGNGNAHSEKRGKLNDKLSQLKDKRRDMEKRVNRCEEEVREIEKEIDLTKEVFDTVSINMDFQFKIYTKSRSFMNNFHRNHID